MKVNRMEIQGRFTNNVIYTFVHYIEIDIDIRKSTAIR